MEIYDQSAFSTTFRSSLYPLHNRLIFPAQSDRWSQAFFAIAQIEHQHIKERQAAGIALAKEKGIYTGRKKGTTKAKPEQAKILKEQGLTHAEIAQALNIIIRTVVNYLRK